MGVVKFGLSMPYKYFDRQKNCLVYLNQKASSTYWDNLWLSGNLKEKIKKVKYDLIVYPTTKKYLKRGSKILEGGCGHGTYVYHLSKKGYKCIGVDFARKTISKIKKLLPELNVQFANVRKLPFKNNTFDGYWSMGIIEHSYNGFDTILCEMARVIKPQGYLFLTFPYMSPIRKLKAKLNLYNLSNFKKEPKNFYQFALNSYQVAKAVKKAGFHLIASKPFDGFRGLQSEIPILNFILDPIDNISQKNFLGMALRFTLARLVQPVTSHSILLIFKKETS